MPFLAHLFSFLGVVMNEAEYQRKVIRRLEREFPDCVVIINDPTRIQGIPDILVLYGPAWATLEVKKSRTAHRQPNQEFYVDVFNRMSYSSFIYPENEERVFDELQLALCNRR